MNTSLLSPKSVWTAAIIAAFASIAFTVAAALQQYPNIIVAIAAVAALLVIMAHDYGPRRRRWEPRLAAVRSHAAQRCPLAA